MISASQKVQSDDKVHVNALPAVAERAREHHRHSVTPPHPKMALRFGPLTGQPTLKPTQ